MQCPRRSRAPGYRRGRRLDRPGVRGDRRGARCGDRASTSKPENPFLCPLHGSGARRASRSSPTSASRSRCSSLSGGVEASYADARDAGAALSTWPRSRCARAARRRRTGRRVGRSASSSTSFDEGAAARGRDDAGGQPQGGVRSGHDLSPSSGPSPRALVDVVERCLSKDPSKRFADAAELASALLLLASPTSRADRRSRAPRQGAERPPAGAHVAFRAAFAHRAHAGERHDADGRGGARGMGPAPSAAARRRPGRARLGFGLAAAGLLVALALISRRGSCPATRMLRCAPCGLRAGGDGASVAACSIAVFSIRFFNRRDAESVPPAMSGASAAPLGPLGAGALRDEVRHRRRRLRASFAAARGAWSVTPRPPRRGPVVRRPAKPADRACRRTSSRFARPLSARKRGSMRFRSNSVGAVASAVDRARARCAGVRPGRPSSSKVAAGVAVRGRSPCSSPSARSPRRARSSPTASGSAPSAVTLLNLANCWEKLGRTATAWATYREAASAASRRRAAGTTWRPRLRGRRARADAGAPSR